MSPSKCPPRIEGRWNQKAKLIRALPATKPTFNDILFFDYNLTIEQQGNLIITTVDPNPPFRPTVGYQLGVWTKVYQNGKFFWQLTIADDDDTGIYNFTVKKYKHGKPYILSGYYAESGFSTTNPSQNQAIGETTWTRI